MDPCQFCLEVGNLDDHLVYPCKCKSPVHISCFRQWLDYGSDRCLICEDNYSRLNRAGGFYFPYDGIYPDITTHQLRKYGFMQDKIYMAITYLESQVLNNLLVNMPEYNRRYIFTYDKVFNTIKKCFNGTLDSGLTPISDLTGYIETVDVLYLYLDKDILGANREAIIDNLCKISSESKIHSFFRKVFHIT